MDVCITFFIAALVCGLFCTEIKKVVASPSEIVHRGLSVPETATDRRREAGRDSVSPGQREGRELPSFADRYGHLVDDYYETFSPSRIKQETEATTTEVTQDHVTGSWTPEQSTLVAGMALMLIIIVMATFAFSISVSKEEEDEEADEEDGE